MKIKTTKNITYLEAKKVYDSQSTDLDFSKIVNSLSSKPETKTTSTQFFEADFVIHTNTSHYPISKSPVAKTPSASPSNVQSIARPRANSTTRPHSQSSSKPSSQSSSQSSNQSSNQSRSQSNSQSNPKKNNQRSSSGHNSGRRSNSGGGSSSDRQPKGSNDPIKMANKYGVLHDDMEI